MVVLKNIMNLKHYFFTKKIAFWIVVVIRRNSLVTNATLVTCLLHLISSDPWMCSAQWWICCSLRNHFWLTNVLCPLQTPEGGKNTFWKTYTSISYFPPYSGKVAVDSEIIFHWPIFSVHTKNRKMENFFCKMFCTETNAVLWLDNWCY